jgi:RimJ/RimL family protein N-acetyltransferase
MMTGLKFAVCSEPKAGGELCSAVLTKISEISGDDHLLDNAKKYEQELVQLHYDIAFDPFYNFQQYGASRQTFEIPKDTRDGHYFVSILGTTILGYIGYSIYRVENYVCGVNIIHFGGPGAKGGIVFGRDVLTALKDVFEKYGFGKICFCVVIGNPVEKTYNKLVKRYGGRAVGTFRQDTRLMDGKLYDVKHYEILAEDYFNSKKLKK